MTLSSDIRGSADNVEARPVLAALSRSNLQWLLRPAIGPALVATLCAIPMGSTAQAQKPVALVVVDVKAVALGYRASELTGKAVYNDAGNEIGKLDDFIISRDRVLFAILSVGGFLGIGDRLVALPYTSLRVKGDRIVVPGATKAALGKLPAFTYAR